MRSPAAVALLVAMLALRVAHALATDPADNVVCGVDEIQLASDGTIDRRSLQLGERVAPNHTLSGAVSEDEYHFYHLCIVRHEHEHQINVNLTVEKVTAGGRWRSFHQPDANLYMSSEELHPRVGHSTWIAQHVGDDFVKLYTYLDGFPRQSDSRSIPLHIGVRGVSSARTTYNLTVSVLDLPRSKDVEARERYYSKQHQLDRERFGGGAAASAQRSRRLRLADSG